MSVLVAAAASLLVVLLALVGMCAVLAMPVGMIVGSIVATNTVAERRSYGPAFRRQLAKGLLFMFGPPAVLIGCLAGLKGIACLAQTLTT